MSFKDLDIKEDYDSDEDNLVSDFYIPILSNAKMYYRRSGFFSSSSLAVSARGIGELIRNDGKMKLICNVHLSREDHESLKRAIENPDKFLEESSLGDDLDKIEDEIERDHVEALGWMLANDFLEIKIAFPSSGIGVYHPKVGIFHDGENYISFSGSENESFSGMLYNIEEFKVFKSWEYNGHLALKDLNKFENEWNGITNRTTVVDLPQAIKEELIKFAPHEKADLSLLKKDYYADIFDNKKKSLSARDYQSSAVKSWFENDCRGIFNMATGSGKTITALNCYKSLKEISDDNFLTIISCPQTHLVNQWVEEIKKYFDNEILSTIDNNKWEHDLKLLMIDMKRDEVMFPFVVTTHKTFSNPKFKKIICNRMKKRFFNVFLIVDEVHGVGSSVYQTGLLPSYKYRLGLSATPERWFDDDGTNVIYDYFDKSVFEFTLDEAIEKGFLTEYEYWPHFIELNGEEYKEYMELTRKIAISYYNNKNMEDLSNTGDYIRRQSIIDHAESKYVELKKILKLYGPWDHLLVYCSSKPTEGEKQIYKVKNILSDNDVISHKFTSEETNDERSLILDYFDKGMYHALTAMKCLDEGVDVKSAKNAILMASTSNPREHIQRRGRILRKSPGKDLAIIDDMIVVPKSTENLTSAELTLIKKEFERYEEFMKSATNDVVCIEMYRKWRGI